MPLRASAALMRAAARSAHADLCGRAATSAGMYIVLAMFTLFWGLVNASKCTARRGV
jgi:hypothetical protein